MVTLRGKRSVLTATRMCGVVIRTGGLAHLYLTHLLSLDVSKGYLCVSYVLIIRGAVDSVGKEQR